MGANGKKNVQSDFKVFPFLPFCLSNSRISLIFRGEKEGRGEIRIAKKRKKDVIGKRERRGMGMRKEERRRRKVWEKV
jgi:hypothetical protein